MTKNKKSTGRLLDIIGDQSNRSFANMCEISEATVRNIKKGQLPGRATLEKIAKRHGTTVDYLLNKDNSSKTGEISATLGHLKHRQKKQEETENEGPTTEINVQDGLSMTEMVLLSNTSYADALWVNIKSFAKAVEMEKDMSELKENMREIDRKISDKMERMENLLLSLGATDQQKRDKAANS